MQNSIEKLGVSIENGFKLKGAKSGNSSEDFRLKEATQNFEKIFVTHMIKDMWKTIGKEEGSEIPGQDIYMEMMQSALATELVKGNGLGIGKMLYDQIKNGAAGPKAGVGGESDIEVMGNLETKNNLKPWIITSGKTEDSNLDSKKSLK